MKEDISSKLSTPLSISGHVRPLDVEFLEDVAGENWNGDCAVYAFNSGQFDSHLYLTSMIHQIKYSY